jgi:hypothetical protein
MLVPMLLVVHDLLLEQGSALSHLTSSLRLVTLAAAYDVPKAGSPSLAICGRSDVNST